MVERAGVARGNERVDAVELFADGLSDEQQGELEAYLRSFESSWDENLLGQRLRALPEEPLCRPALLGMIAIDLRLRRESGHRVSVKSYLKRIPEMGPAEEVPAQLLLVEYLARRRMGEEATVDDFAPRFPDQIEELRQLVADMPEDPIGPKAEGSKESSGSHPGLSGLPPQFGRYEIVRKLGRGGMGQVYLARDSVLGREVAVKVPRLDKNDRILHARFLREAQLAAQLHHPNICTIHDAGVEQGIHFLTMAYIQGTSLSDLIREGKRWKPQEAAEVVRQLARGLAHAHSKGVIHRDLKPANVMIAPDGQAIIMDFGLARQVQSDEDRLTRDGATMGTPIYMSPEQAKGARDQTGSGDIYSLGVILYEVLTGRVPFEGSNFEVLAKILMDPPPPPSTYEPSIDSGIEAICLKSLAKLPENRFETMDEFAKALEQYLNVPGLQSSVPMEAVEARPAPVEPKSGRKQVNAQTIGGGRRDAPETMTAEPPRQKRAPETVFAFDESERSTDRLPPRRKPAERKKKTTRAEVPKGLLIGGGIALGSILVSVIGLIVVVRMTRKKDDTAEGKPAVTKKEEGKKEEGKKEIKEPPVGTRPGPQSADVTTDIEALNAWLLAGKDGASYVREHGSRRLEAWRKAANDGTIEGQFLLGLYFYTSASSVADRREAVAWFRKAAERGYAAAQQHLGFCYTSGFGIEKPDPKEAFNWFLKAAEQGNPGSQYNVGVCYLQGKGVAPNPKEAAEWYRKAAIQGNANAQNSLGFCYDRGVGVGQNFTEAVTWFRKAAEHGLANAQHNLAVKYDHGEGVTPNPFEAAKWFRKAAEQGFAASQHQLGGCYALGKGVTKDLPTAVSWYEKAAEQGNTMAQGDLGFCYFQGLGVGQDYYKAVEWFNKAAEKGYAPAMDHLGNCHANGLGVAKKDWNQAVYWFRKAAGLGHVNAKLNLGICIAKGDGATHPPDLVEGARLMKEAALAWQKLANAGDVSAKYSLGRCYFRGYGVPRNQAAAASLWQEAANAGHAEARKALEDLRSGKMR
jgi:TPR repeat protein/serine/threonine protein kinase